MVDHPPLQEGMVDPRQAMGVLAEEGGEVGVAGGLVARLLVMPLIKVRLCGVI